MKVLSRRAISDTYTKLLIPCEGANTDTVFRDLCATPKTITTVGTAQISTAQSKFGKGSLLLDGNSDYLTIAASADWNFGTSAMTLDGYIYGNGTVTGEIISWGHPNLRFVIENSKLKIVGAGLDAYLGTETVGTDAWHHVALVRNGNVFTGYIDGVASNAPQTSSGSLDLSALTLAIGTRADSPSNYWNGWMQRIRVSKGIARWTANFTPPTRRY